MATGAHLIELGEMRNPAQVGDASGVHDRRANEVDELFGDQRLAVVDRVEYLAHRDRRDRVLADETEALLVLRGRRVLHPE